MILVKFGADNKQGITIHAAIVKILL